MGNVKVIREALVLEVLDRTLERNHVPFHRNVFFNGTVPASSTSRFPAQDAEACLLEETVGHAVVEAILRLGENCLRKWASRKTGLTLPEVAM